MDLSARWESWGVHEEYPIPVYRGTKKEEASFETSSCGDFVRWARLELAQAYAHYPLKVACLPFHHHRFFVLGLQRYALFLNFQTFSQKFSNIFQKIFDHMFYHADFQDNRPKILSE